MNKIARFFEVMREDGLPSALSAASSHILIKALSNVPLPLRLTDSIIRREFRNWDELSIPLWERFHILSKGFPSHYWYNYGLDDKGNYKDYFDEYARSSTGGHGINTQPDILRDKYDFYDVLDVAGYGSFTPEVYGLIKNGTFFSHTSDNILSLLTDNEKLVMKPRRGSGGDGVYICEVINGQIMVNGDNYTECEMGKMVEEVSSYLVQEYVEQADYAKEIYPHSANTIRVLTMKPKDQDTFIADVIHRFGTNESGKLDNFSGKGGLSVKINQSNGELGTAIKYGIDKKKYDSHPTTKKKIKGQMIPGWKSIRDQLLQIADDLPGIQYVGWDLLIIGEGDFIILEANNGPGVITHQVHEPLLNSERVRDFYIENDISVN